VLGEGLSEESAGYEYRPRSPFGDSHPFSTLKFFFCLTKQAVSFSNEQFPKH
jgi:hypothetical protein